MVSTQTLLELSYSHDAHFFAGFAEQGVLRFYGWPLESVSYFGGSSSLPNRAKP